jgi:hypothetical protein
MPSCGVVNYSGAAGGQCVWNDISANEVRVHIVGPGGNAFAVGGVYCLKK